jgi:Tetracyclin repressor-like, C-terminal domain
VPAGLRDRLPTLLWLAYLGVTLHWVTDPTPGQERTRRLVDRLAPLLARMLGLARLPVARGLVDDVLGLMEDLVTDRERVSRS